MSRFPTLLVSATSIIVISILCSLAPPASTQEFIEPDWFVEGNQVEVSPTGLSKAIRSKAFLQTKSTARGM